MGKFRKLIYFYIILVLVIIFAGSYTLGKLLAQTQNIKQTELFVDFNPALPSRILDIRGDLITEFSMDEKRELVDYADISPYLIRALLAREDRIFYEHKGFRIKSIIRAVIGQLIGKNFGGGSTITQQIAGLLHSDRTNKSIKRKIEELMWAIQMERRYSKDEILILYLNDVYFGGGTHGVSAASRFYFGHSAEEITPAEAAMLVIQLSNPTRYNPFNYPNRARSKQESVLKSMIKLGFISEEEAYKSFETYWSNFDYTRIALSAWFTREDKARWASEFVRREAEASMYGTMNLYKDGYTINTTFDLRHQALADKHFQNQLKIANARLKASSSNSFSQAEQYSNLTSLLSLCFNIDAIHLGEKQVEVKTKAYYRKKLNNTLDILSLMSGIDRLKALTKQSTAKTQELLAEKKVEGTFACIENETGYLTALIGGSQYSESNQLIRATQSKLQVGSTIKPLIYSAAIDAKKITPATSISDTPCVFENAKGVQYIPNNYGGKWRGTVLVYKALPLSLNIPAIRTLDLVGFDGAINRIATLTGINDIAEIRQTFEPVYPLALGICAITPIQLLKAFATFANQGKTVDPIAIRSIEDRNGSIIMDPELDLRIEQRKRGSAMQVISPQNAFVMTKILEKTFVVGTLYGASAGGKKFEYKDKKTGQYFKMPMAGKTGTTQNWADSWAAIYSPYYSTIVWYGFDRGNFSLGTNNTGSMLSGYVATNFMRDIHKDLPFKDFVEPETGVIQIEVCKKSGMLPSENCTDGTVELTFIAGTEPTSICTEHTASMKLRKVGIKRLQKDAMSKGEEKINIDKTPLSLDPAIFKDPEPSFKPSSDDDDYFDEEDDESGDDEDDYNYSEDLDGFDTDSFYDSIQNNNSNEQGNPIDEEQAHKEAQADRNKADAQESDAEQEEKKENESEEKEEEENPWI